LKVQTQRERNRLNQSIIEQANHIGKEIDRYNVRVLIVFLREELSRDYNEINHLKKEKFRIQMMLSKLKKDIFKDGILLDAEELNKVF
jgi:hypothetical protein